MEQLNFLSEIKVSQNSEFFYRSYIDAASGLQKGGYEIFRNISRNAILWRC
jgi:hypothetical protein